MEISLNNRFLKWVRYRCKRILFPGLEFHTRSRYRFLPQFFRPGLIDTLDAGSGNGYLAWAAYKLGNRVLAIDKNPQMVARTQDFFQRIGAKQERLTFAVHNLYDLRKLDRKFDQIICSETLEHIKEDRATVRCFYDLLRPGGVLHLCCPFARHPGHNLGRVDEPETGGHVRDGYTPEGYRELLESVGFRIMISVGLGAPVIVSLDKKMCLMREKWGEPGALILFLLSLPLELFDHRNPSVPFSIYAQALKPHLT